MTSQRFVRYSVFSALVLALGASSHRASACGGPCAEPDLRDVKRVGDELYVVTNFGLLRTTEDGWHVECEELFSGVVTKTSLSDDALLVASSVGFFQGTGDICTWEERSQGASNSWFLDFATTSLPADAGAGLAVVALVNDRETSEGNVEMAVLGEPFTTLARFESTAGLRKLVAGGNPPRVYTTGYTYGPRVWHVYSAPLGESVFDERTVDAEDDPSEFVPLAADPIVDRLWIRQAMTTDAPDALWALDGEDTAPRRVLRLARGEKIVDIAFSDEGTYVAVRGETSSAIFHAAPGEVEFAQSSTLDLKLACLEITDRGWLACNSDFTIASEWLIASSTDGGEQWTPELTIGDLGTVTSCGQVCTTTSAWLYGVFGMAGPTPTGGAGRDLDASVPPREDAGEGRPDEPDDSERPAEPKRAGDSSGCSVNAESRGAFWFGAWTALVALAGLRIRRRLTP